MAEFFGAIMRALGQVLAGIYSIVPSYAFAIVVLTILVRVVLIPLTIKQIRSMNAMQKIQPELKKIQTKYKGDRQKLNEEMMRLYKEHGVNPLGGCLPLVMQAPVFIALFSVLRASVPGIAVPVDPASLPTIAPKVKVACHPLGQASIEGEGSNEIQCTPEGGEPFTIRLKEWQDPKTRTPVGAPPYITRCDPQLTEDRKIALLVCHSPGGTGHLPKDSRLFRDIVADKTKFVGMELGCSPTQALSKFGIQQCAPPDTKPARFPGAAGYWVLVLGMVATTYFQQKQMMNRPGAAAAPPQMQAMTKIMPFFLGFISLNIPVGVIIYWVVSNFWTIGQQTVFLKKQQTPPDGSGNGQDPGKPKGPHPKLGKGSTAPNAKQPGGKQPSAKQGKGKRKR